MQPARGQSQDDVTCGDPVLVQGAGTLDGADRTATQIVATVEPAGATWSRLVSEAAALRASAYLRALDDPGSEANALEAARTELEALFAAADAVGEPLPDELCERVRARDGDSSTALPYSSGPDHSPVERPTAYCAA